MKTEKRRRSWKNIDTIKRNLGQRCHLFPKKMCEPLILITISNKEHQQTAVSSVSNTIAAAKQPREMHVYY